MANYTSYNTQGTGNPPVSGPTFAQFQTAKGTMDPQIVLSSIQAADANTHGQHGYVTKTPEHALGYTLFGLQGHEAIPLERSHKIFRRRTSNDSQSIWALYPDTDSVKYKCPDSTIARRIDGWEFGNIVHK